jgi:hypothetical protein
MGKPLLPPLLYLLKALITTDSTDDQEHSVVIPNPFETEEKKEWQENFDMAMLQINM